ncbi:hypothetical protein GCM10007977_022560 [Dactylosporangium sucinum]|uniref:Uncharacterized protein n=1 Tax=Dactylosporangium sucinum TaxID=1424081 RepID=A0A917TFL7_9ACTN|nr:hypothetical protein GCM10007977_022560 [Dactylosporangium sucinum]
MQGRRSTASRPEWLWPAVALAVALIGAAALCLVGVSSVTANYDGVTSWINVVAIGSCCAAATLILLALPLAWFTREAIRDSNAGD